MQIELSNSERHHGKWFFLGAFWVACTLFWWLPSVIFRLFLKIDDPVTTSSIFLSLVAASLFTLGFLLARDRLRLTLIPDNLIGVCRETAYKLTAILAIPALFTAVRFSLYRAGVDYGSGEGLGILEQSVLYSHLFFGFMFIGSASLGKEKRRILIAGTLLIVPRLIISLHWGRFFLAQAILPLIIIAIARGWMRISARRLAQFGIVASLIVFIPPLTRGDKLGGSNEVIQFLANGSTLRLFQDNRDLDLSGRCAPLLVSMTAKMIPYHLLGMCVLDVWGMHNVPATLDRILASNEPASDFLLVGPGSNYLLELFLTGGIWAVMCGSVLFGYTCRLFLAWSGRRSLFAGIWAECLTRALLAPRSNLGYVYERIPGLVVATVVFLLAIQLSATRLIEVDNSAPETTA